ncbi:carbon storage regulator [Velocimicrobium porci]|uniref:Carbon storage regulator n=1 Tax=Velocimicrobium porci TaxID=2606634 RepID=A0A6L5Y1E2_9FIRM|nr:carbon storage regulator [Velocimicrobium porci]MSS64647.1 carbon storage regulator [Velocimicrobium porci]
MLKFTIKPGEYFMIGEEIKVVFLGGMANNCKVMVEAPRSYNIVRASVLEKNAVHIGEKQKIEHYYPEVKNLKEQRKRTMKKQKEEQKKDA